MRSYILHRSWRHAIKDCQICMHAGFNWRLSRRCYNISHLTWQPYILLTAFVHNFLALNKLKVPLCNLTPELTRVRMREISASQAELADHYIAKSHLSSLQHHAKRRWSKQGTGAPVLSETWLLRKNWAEATSCPGLSLANFLVGFPGMAAVCPQTTLQLRSHVFAPQHEGTRALKALKKCWTLGNQHIISNFMFLFLSPSAETFWWCFSNNSLREHHSKKILTLCTWSLENLQWFKIRLHRVKFYRVKLQDTR